jgi:site-specific DNA-methyltransferase (adenine-specific)
LNGNSKERVGHPTQKPRELIQRIVRSLSYPGSIVLDFFGGSGVTTRVAIEEDRHSVTCDIDPTYRAYLQQQFEMLKSEEMEHGRSYEFQFSETLDSCHPIFWKQGTCGIGANDDGI